MAVECGKWMSEEGCSLIPRQKLYKTCSQKYNTMKTRK